MSVFDLLGGPQAALETARIRAGKMLDPEIADRFARDGPAILRELAAGDLLQCLPEEEPDPKSYVGEDDVNEIAIAFGEAVDLKTPFTQGGARRVFEIVDTAAPGVGLEAAVVAQARRAAALRDIGKAALNNAILEKPGPLSEIEREQVRLHAYHTERVLGRSAGLASEAKLAGMHHERQDGSGYHRALSGASIPMAARVIAAGDALVAMTQPRPQRGSLSLDEACGQLTGDKGLDPDAVAAVVAAAHGSTRRHRRAVPAGLSERQVEVLRLVAQGLSNRQIAEALVVSPRTAEHHVQDIYVKIGVASRAGAALFASEHELL